LLIDYDEAGNWGEDVRGYLVALFAFGEECGIRDLGSGECDAARCRRSIGQSVFDSWDEFCCIITGKDEEGGHVRSFFLRN
jgi:hypothetical protein